MDMDADAGFDLDRVVAIVVGAHIRAERYDRPLAYRLLDQIETWQDEFCDEAVLDPVVLTDLWYLNNEQLQMCPALCVGGPEVNALTAYLTDKIPAAFVVDGQYMVQMDQEGHTRDVCVWGSMEGATEAAVDVFVDRYLDHWLNGLVARVRREGD